MYILPLLAAMAASAACLATARSCNGSPSLCGRKYSNVSTAGVHDSAFVGITPLVDDQFVSAVNMLDRGFNFLQAQTHNLSGTIEMCHHSCLELDAGSFENFLAPIKTWLDEHPNEVLTLLLVNADAIPVKQYADVFAKVGLDKYGFTPEPNITLDEWPTLETMIDQGTRLVVFMDAHANATEVGYIIDEFTYIFETPFDVTGGEEKAFDQCTLDRPAGGSPDGRMYILNRFLDFGVLGIDLPDPLQAAVTNAKANIIKQTDLCQQLYGRPPTMILYDFANLGDPLDAQNILNGL